MPKRGLPDTVRMRHDEHYVEALAASAGAPIGRLIPIDLIDPNPNQPRQVMGDLSELMASIAEKGIIEPLVVRQRGDRFQIIAGERRYQAAVQVGLEELPVVIREVDDSEMHRDRAGREPPAQGPDGVRRGRGDALARADSAATRTRMLARKLGKSRTAITESLSLHAMPEEVKNLCRLADITSKSLLLQIVRQADPQKMMALVERMSQPGAATREDVRKATAKAKPGRPRPSPSITAPNKALQPQIELPQGQGRAGRSHRGARSRSSRT